MMLCEYIVAELHSAMLVLLGYAIIIFMPCSISGWCLKPDC